MAKSFMSRTRAGQANESNTTQWGGPVPVLTLWAIQPAIAMPSRKAKRPILLKMQKEVKSTSPGARQACSPAIPTAQAALTRYRYNRWGQRIETTGEEGARSSSRYDDQGLLVAHTNALGQTTTYAYNAAADLIGVTAADGVSVEFERDAQGQLLTYQYGGPAQPLVQRFQYDAAGRLTQLTNENGAHTTFAYDLMDRLVNQVNFDGRTQGWHYNAAGEVTQSHDENLISRHQYDKMGRLLQRQTFVQNQPQDIQHEHFSYSEAGALAKAWHTTELGGNTITVEFIRDPVGRNIAEIQSIAGPDGNQSWSHTVKRAFNELGIESQTHYEGLAAIEWQTYGSGHLHGVVLDGRSVIDFERDKRHRETKRLFGPTQTQSSYDALSRLSYQHTHSPLIGEANAFKRQHHYDAAGQLTRIETAQGLHQYGYDKAGRLVDAAQPGLALQHYRFDPAGNRLFDKQQAQTPQANWDETVRQHMVDKNFNLLGKGSVQDAHGGEPKWMDNRIKDDGEYHYEYDAWGNLRRKYKAEGSEEHRYHYDSHHRLIRYTLESDSQVQGANYHYDPFGRRVAKQVQHADQDGNLIGDAKTTYYGWDGDRLVLTEHNQRQIHTIYEPGSFVPLIRVEGDKAQPKRTLAQKLQAQSQTMDRKTQTILEGLEQEWREDRLSADSQQWMQQTQLQPETLKAMLDEKPPGREQQIHLYQCDHLGTPLALIDQQGKIAWAARVGPWGGVIAEYNPENLEQPIRLPGQHEDSESGLYYNRHRYYDPISGRYVTQDPIGWRGDINYYIYPIDPILWLDPLGLIKIFTEGSIRVESFPGPQAGGEEHARMGPGGQYHVHVYDKEGNYVRMGTENWQPLTKEDEQKLAKNKKIRDFCNSLSPGEKKMLDRANREVFHRGRPNLNQIMRLGVMQGARAAGRLGVGIPPIRGGGQE
jgi:RHS repeat-associated protein